MPVPVAGFQHHEGEWCGPSLGYLPREAIP